MKKIRTEKVVAVFSIEEAEKVKKRWSQIDRKEGQSELSLLMDIFCAEIHLLLSDYEERHLEKSPIIEDGCEEYILTLIHEESTKWEI